MRPTTTRIAVSALLVVVVAVALATPRLLGPRLGPALAAVHGADRAWLAVALLGFAAGFLASVCAWRTALAASNGRISFARIAASLGFGSLVNAFAPARLGDVAKVALVSRSLDGPDGIWTAGGVYAAVAAARCLSIAALVLAAALSGALPAWPAFALCICVAAICAAAIRLDRWRTHPRIAHLLDGFAALWRSPRLAAKVLAWTTAVSLARLAAVAALVIALGLPHPVLVALVVCAGLDLAGAIPLTPGNLGVASGAVAAALSSRGVPASDGLAVGIAIQALETLLALAIGAASALYLAGPRRLLDPRVVRPLAIGLSVVLAAALGAVAFDLL